MDRTLFIVENDPSQTYQNDYLYRLEGIHDLLRTAFCRLQALKEG